MIRYCVFDGCVTPRDCYGGQDDKKGMDGMVLYNTIPSYMLVGTILFIEFG